MTKGTTPFFSVVIFTKNRSDLAGFAVESVLRQSFSDLEVIVSDNDDTDATAKTINRYNDPRLRYYRTSGKLSMVDNWESGLSRARGEYVLSLTDRSALKSYALERIKIAIEKHREDVYVWPLDVLNPSRDEVCMSQGNKVHEVVPSKDLLDLFLTQSFHIYNPRFPKGLNSCHSKSVLQEIRRSNGGRVFLPVAPDYNLAFLTLTHTPRVVLLNQPLFVCGSGDLSNGGGLYRESDTMKRFLQDLGLTEEGLFDEVPIKAVGLHNLVCNDLMKLKRALPSRFSDIHLDLSSYFFTCWKEIHQYLMSDDPKHSQALRAWEEALDKQPQSIRQTVQARLSLHEAATPWHKRMWSFGYKSSIGKRSRRWLYEFKRDRTLPTKPKTFANIIEAVDWVEMCEKRIPEGNRV